MTSVVVGGAETFVGRAVVRALCARGDAVHAVLSVAQEARWSAPLAALGARVSAAEAQDEGALAALCEGAEVLVWIPALGPHLGDLAAYEQSNVVGVEVALAVARARGVGRLLLLSSEQVTAGNFDRRLTDEAHDYAEPQLGPYAETLALGESLVLAAHGPALQTLALRPGWLWGAGETERAGLWLRWLRAGSLRVGGDGRQPVPSTLGRNVAAAVQCALAAEKSAWGASYAVTDDERTGASSFFAQWCSAVGARAAGSGLPVGLGFAWATAREWVGLERGVARARAVELGRAAHFNLKRTREALGWAPVCSVGDGMRALREWAAKVGGAAALEQGAPEPLGLELSG